MVETITANRIVGRSIGTVMDLNCRQRLAPSMAAASYSSNGTACIAARKISAL